MDEQTLVYVFELLLFGIFLVLFLSVISGNYIVETAAARFRAMDLAFSLDASAMKNNHAVKLGLPYDPSFIFHVDKENEKVIVEKSIAGVKAITGEHPFVAPADFSYKPSRSPFFYYTVQEGEVRFGTWEQPRGYQCPSLPTPFTTIVVEPNTPFAKSFYQILSKWMPAVLFHQPPPQASLVIAVNEAEDPVIFYPYNNATLQAVACHLANALHAYPLPAQEKTLMLQLPQTQLQEAAHFLATLR